MNDYDDKRQMSCSINDISILNGFTWMKLSFSVSVEYCRLADSNLSDNLASAKYRTSCKTCKSEVSNPKWLF